MDHKPGPDEKFWRGLIIALILVSPFWLGLFVLLMWGWTYALGFILAWGYLCWRLVRAIVRLPVRV
jgi:hypothetical protein